MKPKPDPTRIMEMTSAYYDSCVLFTASDLGVFEALARLGPSDSDAIAGDLSLDPRATGLLMNACVAVGLLEKNGIRFQNTPETSTYLVPGSPSDLSRAIRYNRDVYAPWGKLPQFLRTGGPVEPEELHLGEDPERTRTFVLSMHHRTLAIGRDVVSMLSLNGRKRLLDIGGGSATYSALIAKANPEIHCTVLDLPPILKIARELIQAQGLSDRVCTLAGDYLKTEFPDNNDVILLFGVLHRESPDSICHLLHRSYKALAPGGTLYVMDLMTDASGTVPKYSALFALNMALITPHGHVFGDAQLSCWMRSAGFRGVSVRQLPPPLPHWISTGVRPA